MNKRDRWFFDPLCVTLVLVPILLFALLIVIAIAEAEAHANDTCISSHVETNYVPINYGSGVVIPTPFTASVCDQWVPK